MQLAQSLFTLQKNIKKLAVSPIFILTGFKTAKMTDFATILTNLVTWAAEVLQHNFYPFLMDSYPKINHENSSYWQLAACAPK